MKISFKSSDNLVYNLDVEIASCNYRKIFKNVRTSIICNLRPGFYNIKLYNCSGFIGCYSFYTNGFDNINVYFDYYNKYVTFKLTDFYYENMPIERGNIYLWETI